MISQINHKWHDFLSCLQNMFLWEALPGKLCWLQMDPQYQYQTGYCTRFEVTSCRHDESFVWLIVGCVAVKLMLFSSKPHCIQKTENYF